MTNDQSSKVSRPDEIRALFIFGLLAVFASIRVQYSELPVPLGSGSFDIMPIINMIIILWSLYAFFMVIGLSRDIVGKTAALAFRNLSNVFLQWSYVVLAIFMIPVGLTAYGVRFVLMILLIVLIGIIGGLIVLYRKDFSLIKWLKSLWTKDWSNKVSFAKYSRLLTGFVFLFSTYIMLTYPNDAFASTPVIFITFTISAVTVCLMLALDRTKDSEESATVPNTA